MENNNHEQRQGPVLYRIGSYVADNDVKITKDNQNQYPHPIKKNYKELKGADLTRVNLKIADLEGANLYEANLEEAYLVQANLEKANLKKSNLSWAKLEEANLEKANLEGANFRGANLKGAYFFEADLSQANFAEADLTGVNFAGAKFKDVNLDVEIIDGYDNNFNPIKKTLREFLKEKNLEIGEDGIAVEKNQSPSTTIVHESSIQNSNNRELKK
jgi:hypothetical protein